MKQDSYDLILSLRETIKKHNITVIPHKIKAHSKTWSPNHIADQETKKATPPSNRIIKSSITKISNTWYLGYQFLSRTMHKLLAFLLH